MLELEYPHQGQDWPRLAVAVVAGLGGGGAIRAGRRRWWPGEHLHGQTLVRLAVEVHPWELKFQPLTTFVRVESVLGLAPKTAKIQSRAAFLLTP
jgi:hypothetical protein